MTPTASITLSLASLLSTRSLAHPPVLSQHWVAVTPLCQAVPAVGFPLWARVTSGASIQSLAPSGMMPWSLFPITCGPPLMNTWLLPICISTMVDQRSTPWTRSVPFTTAALPHTHTATHIPTPTPTPGWTATPTGHHLITMPPLTVLTTSLTAGLSLQPCHRNPTWERVASPRRTCSLSPFPCPAGSSTPLMATGKTRENMPGSSASARSMRRPSDKEAQATFQFELSSPFLLPLIGTELKECL